MQACYSWIVTIYHCCQKLASVQYRYRQLPLAGEHWLLKVQRHLARVRQHAHQAVLAAGCVLSPTCKEQIPGYSTGAKERSVPCPTRATWREPRDASAARAEQACPRVGPSAGRVPLLSARPTCHLYRLQWILPLLRVLERPTGPVARPQSCQRTSPRLRPSASRSFCGGKLWFQGGEEPRCAFWLLLSNLEAHQQAIARIGG